MIEIENLCDLKKYANFEFFEYKNSLKNKEIILYEDHRCLLTVLYEARRLHLIDENTNVVTFDRHDDASKILPQNEEKIRKFVEDGIENVSQRDFKNFVEFDIRENDDDWVCVGMELGLINNIVNIGNIENDNIGKWENNTYIDKRGKKHYGQVIRHIAYELCSNGGAFGDKTKKDENKVLHDILGFENENVTNFVLDFDLDCFTIECLEKDIAWPEHIFRSMYADNQVYNIMFEMIQNAKFITICRESLCCGGIGESNKILCYLDYCFFGGCLGTTT